MEKYKVSIVLPVYNIVRWLNPCMESLVAQRYTNIEILLGDDGSTDGSAQLCDEWAQKDSRVRVIHKTNGGAASARNACLDQLSGDLVCFVDSDDVVDEDYVAHLVETLECTGSDIAVCGFSYLRKSGTEPIVTDTPNGVYSVTEFLLHFIHDWSCSLLWNKIYRREVIGNIRMDEGHRIDDEFFTYQVVMNSRTVAVTDRHLYHYRLRASSVTQKLDTVKEKVMLDRVEYVTTRYHNVAKRFPEIEQAFFSDALDTISRYWIHSKQMPTAQKQIRAWVIRHIGRLLRAELSAKQKIAYLMHFFLKAPSECGERLPIEEKQDDLFE